MATNEQGHTPDWTGLCAIGARVGALLIAHGATVAVAESSSGGLIGAALLAVPGASAYFRGGATVYTLDAKTRLLDRTADVMQTPRAATEEHAIRLGEAVRDRLGTTWGIGETGASGPTGNRYGDPPGHTCVAVVGPQTLATTITTGHADRQSNMLAFAFGALATLEHALTAMAQP